MILCIGEAVIDMFQKNTPEFGEVFYPLPGGCCYNTSIAIGRLGVPVAFIGRISKSFFGDIQKRRLQENNVRDDFIILCDLNPILSFIKTSKNEQPQYAFYDESTADRGLLTDELPPLPSTAECIVFGSISMVMEPIATTIEELILREAALNTTEQKKVIAFDPNIRPFMIKDKNLYMKRFAKWAGVCTVAKISCEDFEYIFPDSEPEEALKKMLDMGTRLTIVTLGPKGATALLKRDNGSIIRVHTPGIYLPEVADTVGAGDTFFGAFLARLQQTGKLSHNAIVNLSEAELLDALTFANKAAAFVCTQNGAEPPTLQQID
jgi:fructokinase